MGLDETFRRILDQHGAGLGRVCSLYARTKAEEEDLRQEVAFALWRALPSFRGASSERTFAFRIAHNLGQKLALGRKEGVPIEEAELPPTSVPDPERSAEARQRYARLLAALQRLGPEARQVVSLSLEGFSQAEIGEVIGATPNAVAVRLHRAREQLRLGLEEAE